MMTGGDEYKASVVGFDEDKDVAVLKINVEADKVPTLPPPPLLHPPTMLPIAINAVHSVFEQSE